LKELEDAREWFLRRCQRLLDEAHGRNLSEEQQARYRDLVKQFDITARRLLRKADKDIELWQPVVDAPGGVGVSEDQERARISLEAAQELRGLILATRATTAGEVEREDFDA
jgi:hypothetical protein